MVRRLIKLEEEFNSVKEEGGVGGVGGVGPGNQVMIPVTLSTTCKSCREEVYGTQRLLLSNCNF